MGDAAGLKDWVLAIGGNIFIIVLVIRTVGAFTRDAWNEFIGTGFAAIFVAALVYTNANVIAALTTAAAWIFPG